MENNFSTIGNQQRSPAAALVEKLINSVDAVLIKECISRGISPQSTKAPQSIQQALKEFFIIREGKLSNVEIYERGLLEKMESVPIICVKHIKIEQELADIMIYAITLAHDAGIDIEKAILDKLEKNGEKYPLSKSKGNSSKYTDL